MASGARAKLALRSRRSRSDHRPVVLASYFLRRRRRRRRRCLLLLPFVPLVPSAALSFFSTRSAIGSGPSRSFESLLFILRPRLRRRKPGGQALEAPPQASWAGLQWERPFAVARPNHPSRTKDSAGRRGESVVGGREMHLRTRGLSFLRRRRWSLPTGPRSATFAIGCRRRQRLLTYGVQAVGARRLYPSWDDDRRRDGEHAAPVGVGIGRSRPPPPPPPPPLALLASCLALAGAVKSQRVNKPLKPRAGGGHRPPLLQSVSGRAPQAIDNPTTATPTPRVSLSSVGRLGRLRKHYSVQ